MSNATINQVFVYGSMKKGESNNAYINDGTTFIGNASTLASNFLMTDKGYAIVSLEEDGTNEGLLGTVTGEFYKVTDYVMEELDALVNYPNRFHRATVSIKVEGGDSTSAWMYYVPKGSNNGVPVEPVNGLLVY